MASKIRSYRIPDDIHALIEAAVKRGAKSQAAALCRLVRAGAKALEEAETTGALHPALSRLRRIRNTLAR